MIGHELLQKAAPLFGGALHLQWSPEGSQMMVQHTANGSLHRVDPEV